MKTLTFIQKQTFEHILNRGGEVKQSEAGINFPHHAIKALIKKGLVTEEQRSRLREDDREMVYWSVYKLNLPLNAALSEGEA